MELKDNWKDQSTFVCDTCMYFKNMRCRRNAPTMKGFPAVYPTDWCGDHKISKATMEMKSGVLTQGAKQ